MRYQIKYFNEVLTDPFGWPRDFESETEAKEYLDDYKNLERSDITVVELPVFEFELPGNIHNHCKFGYLRDAYSLARRINRYYQLQNRLESVANFQAYRDHKNIVVYLYEDPAPYSFYWVARYRNELQHIMNGGLILHKPDGFIKDDGSMDFNVSWGEYDGWSIHT